MKNKCIDCGKEISFGHKKCKSCAHKGKNNGRYIDGRRSKKNFCIDCGKELSKNPNVKRCYSCANKGERNPCYGKKYSKKSRKIMSDKAKGKRSCWKGKKNPELSKFMKSLWKNKIYREKILKLQRIGARIKPNKPEQKLNKLIQRILPNEYKINVKGEVMILGRKVPDFVNVNGQKKIVELFGDYWHSRKITNRTKKEEENKRINYFKKLGWKTLIIWQRELKNLDEIKNKILEFNKK